MEAVGCYPYRANGQLGQGGYLSQTGRHWALSQSSLPGRGACPSTGPKVFEAVPGHRVVWTLFQKKALVVYRDRTGLEAYRAGRNVSLAYCWGKIQVQLAAL